MKNASIQIILNLRKIEKKCKVHRSKGKTLLLMFGHSKNKLDSWRNNKYFYYI